MSNITLVDPENVVPISASSEWQEIINSIVASLEPHDLPEKVIEASDYLISGFPVVDVAKRVGVSTKTVRAWLVRYPELAAAIKKGQEELQRWRLALIERQFVDAVNFSYGLLSNDSEIVNRDDKVLAQQAKQARYILDMLTGKVKDLHITQINNNTVSVDTVELKATRSSLDYLAQRINETPEDILDAEFEITYVNGPDKGPLVNEEGEPFFGSFGSLDVDQDGILCHICGNKSKKLQPHIASAHGLSPREYENAFRLAPNEIKNVDRSNTKN